MNTTGITKIETLNKDNYDTWRMHMEALLIKNDAWEYVSGAKPAPALDAKDPSVHTIWYKYDQKAKSDIILSISAAELKQVKGCVTSRDVWLKLESVFQSKGPARKATLLKQLTLQRMHEGEDVRGHLGKFFDAVDKLHDMEVEINADLLAIMLLYSLPSSFANFRCAIESRDDLPSPETLRIKIIEESEARKSESQDVPNAMVAGKFHQRFRGQPKSKNKSRNTSEQQGNSKIICYRCRKVGHKRTECPQKDEKPSQNAKNAENFLLFSSDYPQNAFQSIGKSQSQSWCLDSGCSSHMCKNSNEFLNIEKVVNEKLQLASSASAEIKARGRVSIQLQDDKVTKHMELSDALFVPDLRTNLLSVGKITDRGYRVLFDKESAKVVGGDGRVILTARREDGLYFVHASANGETCLSSKSKSVLSSSAGDLQLWHRRLGHLNYKDLSEAIRKETIEGIDVVGSADSFTCETCIQGKMVRTPFPKRSARTSELLELIHSDVCGPMRTESIGKSRYFVTFIDDYSRWCEVRFLEKKSQVFSEFQSVKALLEKESGSSIKSLQSDNGTEYKNNSFDSFLRSEGIRRRLTVAYNPEQNGVAERKNRTLVEMTRCLLIQSGLPKTFWAEALATANYIRNRSPSKSLDGKTPYEVRFGKRPDVSNLREFGCKVFVLERIPNRDKLDAKSDEGIFLGYPNENKGYRVWISDKCQVVISRDVKFLESHTQKIPGSTQHQMVELPLTLIETSSDDVQMEAEVPDETVMASDSDDSEFFDAEQQSDESAQRVPGRPRKIKTGLPGRPRKEYKTVEVGNITFEHGLLAEIDLDVAVSGTDAREWYEAMATELRCIIASDTWEIVDRSSADKVIGSRMVLRNKHSPDGTLERRKARIVARGFAQRPGVDFEETFAPVTRLSSIRLATAIASQYGMTIYQLDITAAYLNGRLSEKIFMEIPDMTMESLQFILRNEKDGSIKNKAKRMLSEIRQGNKVCLLKKALYGLRQAGRCWYERLNKELQRFGLHPTKSDTCVYVRGSGEDMLIVLVYVDDILVISRNASDVKQLNESLMKTFALKDLGEVQCCLGLEFIKRADGYLIHQQGYIGDVLQRFGMADCKPVSTPMCVSAANKCNSEANNDVQRKVPYRELVGSLMYLAMGTRPDIAYAVSWLSQFNDFHKEEHWEAGKRVLRYLQGTKNKGLMYTPSETGLTGMVDADWGNCPNDRRSYTGYAFILAGGAITWESRKQRTVALSSTEAEYMSLTESVKEGIYLQRFIRELGFESLVKDVLTLCDNMGAHKLT